MSKSASHERRVQGYLKPANYSFITKYIEVNKVSESEAVNQAVKALKACQPPEQIQRMLNKNRF